MDFSDFAPKPSAWFRDDAPISQAQALELARNGIHTIDPATGHRTAIATNRPEFVPISPDWANRPEPRQFSAERGLFAAPVPAKPKPRGARRIELACQMEPDHAAIARRESVTREIRPGRDHAGAAAIELAIEVAETRRLAAPPKPKAPEKAPQQSKPAHVIHQKPARAGLYDHCQRAKRPVPGDYVKARAKI